MGGGLEVPPHHVSEVQRELKMIEDIQSKNEITVLVTGFGVCFFLSKLLSISSTTRLYFSLVLAFCRIGSLACMFFDLFSIRDYSPVNCEVLLKI